MTSEQKKQIEDYLSSAAQDETQVIAFERATLRKLLSSTRTTSISFHLARKDDGKITLIAVPRDAKLKTVVPKSSKQSLISESVSVAADSCYPPIHPDQLA